MVSTCGLYFSSLYSVCLSVALSSLMWLDRPFTWTACATVNSLRLSSLSLPRLSLCRS
jgi:hypothetical protein